MLVMAMTLIHGWLETRGGSYNKGKVVPSAPTASESMKQLEDRIQAAVLSPFAHGHGI